MELTTYATSELGPFDESHRLEGTVRWAVPERPHEGSEKPGTVLVWGWSWWSSVGGNIWVLQDSSTSQ